MDINPIPFQLKHRSLDVGMSVSIRGMGSMHWTFLELNRDPQNGKDESSNILNFFKQFLELNHNFWIEILKMSAPTGR